MTSIRRIAIGTLLLGALTIPRASLAAPRLTVGNGTPASCDQTALQLALFNASLMGGGTVRFNCGSGPATISLSPSVTLEDGRLLALTVPDNTVIDGGGLITLQIADQSEILLLVDVGITAGIKNLAMLGSLNAAVVNLGNLIVNNVAFSNTRVGAILNEGTLTVRSSTFTGNFFTQQIWNDGDATIIQSLFLGNIAGAIYNSNRLGVRDSTFTGNGGSEQAEWGGGAITNDGTLRIDNCAFSANHSRQGGTIKSYGTLLMTNSRISGSTFAPIWGGAMYLSGNAVIRNSWLLNNNGGWGGAINNDGVLLIDQCTIAGNTAGAEGGGIYNSGRLTVRDSYITGNSALDGYGVGAFGGGIYVKETASLRLVRTVVSGNSPNDTWPIQ